MRMQTQALQVNGLPRQLCPGCGERNAGSGLCLDCRLRDMDLEARFDAYESSRYSAGVRQVQSLVPHERRVPLQSRRARLFELGCFGVVAVGGWLAAIWLWHVLGVVLHVALAAIKGAL